MQAAQAFCCWCERESRRHRRLDLPSSSRGYLSLHRPRHPLAARGSQPDDSLVAALVPDRARGKRLPALSGCVRGGSEELHHRIHEGRRCGRAPARSVLTTTCRSEPAPPGSRCAVSSGKSVVGTRYVVALHNSLGRPPPISPTSRGYRVPLWTGRRIKATLRVREGPQTPPGRNASMAPAATRLS